MIPLSVAIRKGNDLAPYDARTYFDAPDSSSPGSDPLGAAYLGQLPPAAVAPFWGTVRTSTRDALCAHMLRALHRAWPHLGQSVRYQSRTLAAGLERDQLIPRVGPRQPGYHVSLWKVICDMHVAGLSKEQVAGILAEHGL